MNPLTAAKIKDFFPKHTIPCVQKFILLMECILQSRTVCLYKCRDKAPQLNSRPSKSNMVQCSQYFILIKAIKNLQENETICRKAGSYFGYE